MPATDTPTTIIEHDDRLLTVKELAERLGRRPRWVYANADALGAIRVGEGKHPQLHFQLPIVRVRLAELAARPAESPAPVSATPAPGPAKPRARRRAAPDAERAAAAAGAPPAGARMSRPARAWTLHPFGGTCERAIRRFPGRVA